jgi:hypoxanthine-guanine phosphoribosyltransferase
LETAALIDKTARRDKHVQLDYCGFQVEDGFIVDMAWTAMSSTKSPGYILE